MPREGSLQGIGLDEGSVRCKALVYVTPSFPLHAPSSALLATQPSPLLLQAGGQLSIARQGEASHLQLSSHLIPPSPITSCSVLLRSYLHRAKTQSKASPTRAFGLFFFPPHFWRSEAQT